MKSGLRRSVLGLMVLAAVLSLAACKKTTPVHIVDGPKSEDWIYNRESFMGEGDWIVLFRRDEEYRGMAGKAGEAYRTKDGKLIKIGDFDLKKSNGELAEIYWNYPLN